MKKSKSLTRNWTDVANLRVHSTFDENQYFEIKKTDETHQAFSRWPLLIESRAESDQSQLAGNKP
jgi:hypothetical protein